MKLLKFDTIHPINFYEGLVKDNKDLVDGQSFDDYLDWMFSQRINHSNYYSYNLLRHGVEGYEFLINDKCFMGKLNSELLHESNQGIKGFVKCILGRGNDVSWQYTVSQYIDQINPDIIFLREPSGIDYDFLTQYTNRCLIVTRLNCQIQACKNLNPSIIDVLLTGQTEFKSFFELHGISSYIVRDAFEPEVLKDLSSNEEKYELTFVGALGGDYHNRRSTTLNEIAKDYPLKWWGPKGRNIRDFPYLEKTWQGITGGVEMFMICYNSKIVLNDYPDFTRNEAVNQRIFEVMGCGSLLLTREAVNLKDEFPRDCYSSFKDTQDCKEKIQYYLNNAKQRNELARNAQEHILEYHTYYKRMGELIALLMPHYERKFARGGN